MHEIPGDAGSATEIGPIPRLVRERLHNAPGDVGFATEISPSPLLVRVALAKLKDTIHTVLNVD